MGLPHQILWKFNHRQSRKKKLSSSNQLRYEILWEQKRFLLRGGPKERWEVPLIARSRPGVITIIINIGLLPFLGLCVWLGMACFGVPFNAMFSVYSPFLDIERVSTGARGGDAKEYRRRIKYERKRIIWQKVFLYMYKPYTASDSGSYSCWSEKFWTQSWSSSYHQLDIYSYIHRIRVVTAIIAFVVSKLRNRVQSRL